MSRIAFTVPGTPGAKGRPRFARAGGFVRTYTDAKTVSYENLVRVCFAEAHPGHAPHAGPARLEVRAFFPIPKSRSKRFRAQCYGERHPVTTGKDVDNVLKVFGDALNGIAWTDDRQVYDARAVKWYSERPRVEVEIVLEEKYDV